jgi:2-polyprenyl-3-methyl-5-hydroxy-6-metoxy-1,4-benzoquinol methylase
MPDENFWRSRYNKLGIYSVGTGLSKSEEDLENERMAFQKPAESWLNKLKGPVLDFGCGVGRWVAFLPRPYIGIDLLSEHIEYCKKKYAGESGIEFNNLKDIDSLKKEYFLSIFTCTVLQHIVEKNQRKRAIRNLFKLLQPDGTLISIEWSANKDLDWCTKVTKQDFIRWFKPKIGCLIIAQNVKHTLWVCTKRHSLGDRISGWFQYLLKL